MGQETESGPYRNVWSLSRKVAIAVHSHLDSILKTKANLKLHDFYILRSLREAELSPAPFTFNMKDLAAVTRQKPPTLSYQIDRLEREKLVKRIPLAGDARFKGLALTDTGRELCDKASAIYKQEVHETILGELRPDSIKVITQILEQVEENIKKRAVETQIPRSRNDVPEASARIEGSIIHLWG